MTLIKSLKNEIFLILITGVVVIAVIMFNDVNRFIRVKEMKIHLQKSNKTENGTDHINLIMRYNLQKRLYENRISQEDADIIEIKVNSIISEITSEKKPDFEKYHYAAPPVLFTVNVIRKLIGKPEIIDIADNKSNIHLEIAYFYERNKFYNKALNIYQETLLDTNIERETKAGVFLHQGFCYSILGNYNKAREKYKEIINDYGDLSLALTAAILLRYIEGFRSEAERIIKTEKDSVSKGEKLYNLIAYKESAEVLKRVEKDVSPDEKSKLLFYKARNMEELEQKEQALNTYQELIRSDHKSPYAKRANRRIFMIGYSALTENSEKIKELAITNNKVLDDDVLNRMVDISNRLKNDSGLDKNPLSKKAFNTFISDYPVIENKKLILNALEIKPEKPEPVKAKSRRKFKIYTSDGNIFSGIIVSETKESILLKTIIGDINIEKNAIKKKELK